MLLFIYLLIYSYMSIKDTFNQTKAIIICLLHNYSVFHHIGVEKTVIEERPLSTDKGHVSDLAHKSRTIA